MFETIYNDIYILNIYNEIEKNETKQNELAKHGLSHINNVIKITKSILKQLNYDEEIIEASKIAALLHDLGMIEGKKNHAIKSYELAKYYFNEKNIYHDYYNEILKAIKNHSEGFNDSSIITQILIFADKIDITKDRLALGGYEVIGLRQLQYIEEIKIEINNGLMEIKFIVNDKCDKIELEKYYFLNKVFKSINSLANYLKLESKVYYNDGLWEFNIK